MDKKNVDEKSKEGAIYSLLSFGLLGEVLAGSHSLDHN
jgi:hypothetical protein